MNFKYLFLLGLTLVVSFMTVNAVCPSNGNAHVIYVTSNMGDNIWSFDTQGNFLGDVIANQTFPEDVKVAKLRAMRFGPEGHLYVSSASGSYSRIFAVSGNGLMNESLNQDCTRNYMFTVSAQSKEDILLDHPYDFYFHPETNDLYVSNQNSISITRYTYKKGTKDAIASWELTDNNKFALPSKNSSAAESVAELLPDGLPAKAGLFVSSFAEGYTVSSVRGIVISPPFPRSLVDAQASPGYFVGGKDSFMRFLLVCDPIQDTVHVFDVATGEYLFGLYVPSPIQVAFPVEMENYSKKNTSTGSFYFGPLYVYVTSKEDGRMYMVPFSSHTSSGNRQHGFDDARTSRAHRLYAITDARPTHALSGFYEHPSRGILYIADRTGRKLYTYASPFVTKDFENSGRTAPYLAKFTNFPDQPEFVLSALLENQKNIPFCYELSADGRFRYVALCSAAYGWSFLLAVALVVIPSLIMYGKLRDCCFNSPREGTNSVDINSKDGAERGEDAPLLGGAARRVYGSTR